MYSHVGGSKYKNFLEREYGILHLKKKVFPRAVPRVGSKWFNLTIESNVTEKSVSPNRTRRMGSWKSFPVIFHRGQAGKSKTGPCRLVPAKVMGTCATSHFHWTDSTYLRPSDVISINILIASTVSSVPFRLGTATSDFPPLVASTC